MQDHHYDKQAKLYIQAMRAFLAKKGLSENTFGGMLYVFLRGLDAPTQGIFVCR
jgi:ATP-dependent exoDNAse (exonuclease V) beta subunit